MTPTRRLLSNRLADGPGRIADAARDAAAVAPEPGGWTPQQVVLHLVAVEVEVFQQRLADLATQDEPSWTWTEPGPAEAPPGESLADALKHFASARAATLATVAALDEAGWRRSGRHATLGRLDVAALLDVAVAHDQEHLRGLRSRDP